MQGEKILQFISKLQMNDKVFEEKIDNFILENREDRRKIYEEVKQVKTQLEIMNGSVKSIQLWRERVRGNLDSIRVLFMPIILAIIYLYLDKFF